MLGGADTIGDIEADPTQAIHPRLRPGVMCFCAGLALDVQVSGHVARRDTQAATRGNEDVRMVLAHALAVCESFCRLGMSVRGAGDVFDPVADTG